MVPVADVARSAAFYKLLGFEIGNRVPETGEMGWAWLYSPQVENWKRGPNLMLSRTDKAFGAGGPEVVFYLYAADLVELREKLIEQGLDPGEICYPFYLPAGEFELRDPDGHCLMIAQSEPNTP
jgi:catechol 2,3-dioxygenase-like lactoylglutathione lyase family enzyme